MSSNDYFRQKMEERRENIQQQFYEEMKQAWVQAWTEAKCVENVREITIRVAENKFDEYWQQNYGEIPE